MVKPKGCGTDKHAITLTVGNGDLYSLVTSYYREGRGEH
jgi:hypothetical protein